MGIKYDKWRQQYNENEEFSICLQYGDNDPMNHSTYLCSDIGDELGRIILCMKNVIFINIKWKESDHPFLPNTMTKQESNIGRDNSEYIPNHHEAYRTDTQKQDEVSGFFYTGNLSDEDEIFIAINDLGIGQYSDKRDNGG